MAGVPRTHQTMEPSLHIRTGIHTRCHWFNSLLIFPVSHTGNIILPHLVFTSRSSSACCHVEVETLKMKHEQPYVIPHQFVLKSAACVMLCAEPQMCVLEVLANDTLKYVIIKKLQYFSKKSSSLQRSLTPADWDSNSNSQTTWAGPYLL